jgi:hypothetical protein
MIVRVSRTAVSMRIAAWLSRPNVRARERRLIRPNASATSTLIKTTTRLITSNLSAVLFVGATAVSLILGGFGLVGDIRTGSVVKHFAAVLFGLNCMTMRHCILLEPITVR